MSKRGESGLSLLVGVDKPAGMSSHDVVNRCRRIFGERRVGHTGTLDPLATGALLVCVGPATRLDAFFTGHDKKYQVKVAFGAATETDDAAGSVTRTAPVPDRLRDVAFAREYVESLVGEHSQLPPVYSALKVNGKKACDEARKGNVIDLQPRSIRIYQAVLLGIEEDLDAGLVLWDVEVHVSKGTYVRSIARDMGLALGCPAHVAALRRTQAGRLSLVDCVSLETLEQIGTRASLDPVLLLGYRFLFADEAQAAKVANGNPLRASEVRLCCRPYVGPAAALCACTSGVRESKEPPSDGEVVAVIAGNKLVALYEYSQDRRQFHSRCVFPVGVSRGEGI
ncbi:MAG: tRNA pseudouridine(55) synthase TruB [Eggerthellales bacterium]|nr:tRNA pseudouridine(55) synthase TruB [Eggerthellales bacterium]